MNTSRDSRVDQIIALIDACLAEVEGSLRPAATDPAPAITGRPGADLSALTIHAAARPAQRTRSPRTPL